MAAYSIAPMVGHAMFSQNIARGFAAIGSVARAMAYTYRREKECDRDPDTGLYLKATQTDSLESDCKKVNSYGYVMRTRQDSLNHVSCIAAMEMRRRGYDVVADLDGPLTNMIGANFNPVLSVADRVTNKVFGPSRYSDEPATLPRIGAERNGGRGAEKRLTKDFTGARFNSIEDGKIVSTLEKQPEGSRGALFYNYDTGRQRRDAAIAEGRKIETKTSTRPTKFGQALYYTIKNGRVMFCDPRSGQVYSGPTDDMLRTHGFKYASEGSFIRLDTANLNISNIIDEIL